MEDLISIGTIGLIKAIESYRPNKGTKLATFAARCIENEILMHLRSLKKTRKDVSLHDPIGTDKEGNEITLIDILGSETDDVIKEVDLKIEKSKIYRNHDILDEREKEVVVGRFGLDTGGEERMQREIAKDLGISLSYVLRIEKRVLIKCKEFKAACLRMAAFYCADLISSEVKIIKFKNARIIHPPHSFFLFRAKNQSVNISLIPIKELKCKRFILLADINLSD